MTRETERSEHFTVTVDRDATLLDAEDELYEALRAYQDYRHSGDLTDLHEAQVAIMRAYCINADAIQQTPEVR
jgi:hypothetical protein